MKLVKSILLSSIIFISNAFAAININTATVEELKALKGVGDVKAKAIVEYRTNNGNFAKVEDLVKVKGIGEKILEDNKAELIVVDDSTETEASPTGGDVNKPAAEETTN